MEGKEGAEDARWCQRLADQLAVSAGVEEALLTPALHAAILALARDVAHATERRNAPVAAFLVGRYLQVRQAQGVEPVVALSDVQGVVAALLPPARP